MGGCRSDKTIIPYEKIDLTVEHKPISGSNAYRRYVRLADKAQKASIVGLDARPTAGNRRKELKVMQPLLNELSSACLSNISFEYSPVGPFEKSPYREGWLRIGRSLVWLVEELVAGGKIAEAARWVVVATVFGVDLGGGTMSDASLGYEIIDGTRAALSSHLPKLSATELGALRNGLSRALDRMPNAITTINNESIKMLAAIKIIQDAHKEHKLSALSEKFYGKSRTAIVSIEKFNDERRSDFFKALLEEQKNVSTQLLALSANPGSERGTVSMGVSGEERTIAENFFYTGDAWMRMRDRALARTRLFVLTTSLILTTRSQGRSPESLDSFPEQLTRDPYTGRPLGYISLGTDYILYSFGTDGKDDRGDTNVKRLEPDLRLEDAPL